MQRESAGAGNRDETTAAGRAGYERNMLEFIRRWHRFGGGSARDIFVEFGLAEHEFFSRTLELLQTGLFAETTDETVEYIRKVSVAGLDRWFLTPRMIGW